MKVTRRVAGLIAVVPVAGAATFLPSLASHQSAHALPTVAHIQVISAPAGSGISSVPLRRDPTYLVAIHTAGYGAAGAFGPKAIDFIFKMTKKLVTLAEDDAESSSSDSSSSGSPTNAAFSRLFPSGDSQFNVSG